MYRRTIVPTIAVLMALSLLLGACVPATPAPAPPAAQPAAAPTTAPASAPVAPAAGKEPVKVAVVLNLTTAQAVYGTPMRNGVQMATDKVNAEGGIAGRPIQLIIEDAADTATTGMNAMNKAMEQNPIAMIGPVLGAQMLPGRKLIDEQKIPTVSMSGTRGWTMDNNKYAFRVSGFDGVTRPALADWIVGSLNAKKVGILAVNNEWGSSGRDNLAARLKSKWNITPVVEMYQTQDTDMSAQLMRLKNAGVDVIYSHGHPADTAIIMRQWKELGITAKLVACDVAQTSVNMDITQPETAEGLYVETFALPWQDTDPTIHSWAVEYNKRFNMIPDAYALLQYDGAMVLYDAMKKAAAKNNLTRQGITDELWTIESKGLITSYKADKEGNMMWEFLIVRYGKNKLAEVVQKVKVTPADAVYELPKN